MYITRRVQGYFIFDCRPSSSLDTITEIFGFCGSILKTIETTIKNEELLSSSNYVDYYIYFLDFSWNKEKIFYSVTLYERKNFSLPKKNLKKIYDYLHNEMSLTILHF